MAVFSLKSKNLTPIKEMRFQKECEIQKLVEHNLQTLLGLEFVRSEYTISGRRIDSLAYDPKKRAFVIIEYKRGKNHGLFEQGLAYLSIMKNNRAEFVLRYHECCHKELKIDDVVWDQSKVIFISQDFTSYQKEAEPEDPNISLWEIKRFSNQTVCFEEIRKNNTNEGIKTVSRTSTANIVNREIKVYTEADCLNPATYYVQCDNCDAVTTDKTVEGKIVINE